MTSVTKCSKKKGVFIFDKLIQTLPNVWHDIHYFGSWFPDQVNQLF